MTLVVDASAAIKWVVKEEGHSEVLRRSAGQRLAAPDFVLVEAASILWKKVRLSQLDKQQAHDGYAFIRDAYEVLSPTPALNASAFEMSLRLDHPIYDCLYLVCAAEEQAEILTSDKRLAAIAAQAGVTAMLVPGGAP